MMADEGESPLARSTCRRIGQVAALAALLILTVVLLGCGDDDGSDSNGDSDTGFGPQVVAQEDIDGQEEGSPGSSLLEWWQAFQFQDAATVVSLTSENTLDDVGKKNLEELVKTRGQGLQGVEVLGAGQPGFGLRTRRPSDLPARGGRRGDPGRTHGFAADHVHDGKGRRRLGCSTPRPTSNR